MSSIQSRLPSTRRLGQTMRRDAWWRPALLTVLGLGAFIVYSTWAGMQADHFFATKATRALLGGGESMAHYLSPMYSPVLFDIPGKPSGHAWFGEAPGWLTGLFPGGPFVYSPALLILWAPAGFRFTCYYYRGAYYKAFWGDPISCAVGEPGFRGTRYRGEQLFPLILQNVHRYFLYFALIFLVFLAYDAVIAYTFTNEATGAKEIGVGVGSLVLTINPILLGAYTFGCHSLRHLIGGRKDTVGSSGAAPLYNAVSCLNKRHMQAAWSSLFWVGFTDFYVRMCSMGVWTDYRIL